MVVHLGKYVCNGMVVRAYHHSIANILTIYIDREKFGQACSVGLPLSILATQR